MSDPSRPTEFSATSELDQLPDRDTEETSEWQASLDAVVRNSGPDRAVYLLRRVHEYAARSGTALPELLSSDYINTIPASAQPVFPGEVAMEARITALNRWNAAAMVTRGSRLGLGGHIDGATRRGNADPVAGFRHGHPLSAGSAGTAHVPVGSPG
jgi:pyruvate dehydrogenase E1 component